MVTADPVIRGACLGWRPPTRLTPWQWAAKHVKLQGSERSPKFDPEQTPWWKSPMECMADADTRQVVVMAPTGSGKSAMAEALIPYVVSEDPGSFLYASQTDPDAKFFADTRLMPALRSCEPLRGLWPEDRSNSRKMEIIFPHMALILGGANMSNFQEKSCRFLYGDEAWAWAAGLMKEFLARHHNRWNRKVFIVSQGGLEDGELDQEWKKSDMAEFGWKCGACGHEQPYDFDSLRFEVITDAASGAVDAQASADTARMECSGCRAAFPDTIETRRRMASSNMHNGALGYIAAGVPAIRGVRGFRVDSLAVWWIPWAEDVLLFLEAKRMLKLGVVGNLRKWRQKRRARPWSPDAADAQITLPKSDYTKADYENGQHVPGEARRFMTIDVGGDHYWWMVGAWRPNGGGVKILADGYHLAIGGREEALAAIAKRYKVEPQCVFLDIGFNQMEQIDLCATHGWTGIKGDGTAESFDHVRRGYPPVKRLFSMRRRVAANVGGVAFYFVFATNPVKDIAYRILTGQGAPIELPGDISKAFGNHIKAERREKKINKSTGKETSAWVQHHRANHLWDTLVYQVIAAYMDRLFIAPAPDSAVEGLDAGE